MEDGVSERYEWWSGKQWRRSGLARSPSALYGCVWGHEEIPATPESESVQVAALWLDTVQP